jgi:hypothetical protein
MKVEDLAKEDNGFGTVNGEKADLVWQTATENMDKDISEFIKQIPVSDSYIRKVLKELPPEAFGF